MVRSNVSVLVGLRCCCLRSAPLVAIASGLLITAMVSITPRAIANSNFGRVRITSGNQSIEGYTGGSFSLSEIAREDQQNRPCIGYADSDPDHILELAGQTGRITLEVNSSGHDTTLIVQGPDGKIYCGDDEGNGADALIQGRNWLDGDYKVWVGTFDPGERYNYTLVVRS